MTPYIKNQLIKLCDHPEWFNYMLTIWDNNPEEPHTAIRNYLSHVQLDGLLENTLESQEIKFIQTTTAIKDI